MSTTFHSLGLSEPLVEVLSRQGITEPFPIQESAIPHGLAGRDLQGRAPTGSGKTLAFGLPLLTRIRRGGPKQPRALVLAPTRELAEQIRRDLAPLAEAEDRRIAAIFGGVGYGPQKKALQRGVDVLVATPGRLEDLIEQRFVDLGHVEVVVLDEADRMADMGFMPAVRRILDRTPNSRQTLLFSATLDGDVAGLSRKYQRDPVTVAADASEEQELDVVHHFWRVDRPDRLAHTSRVIAASERVIVFTRTRHGADRLGKQLAKTGISAVAMHGGRSQNQRTRALRAFTNGTARALVATDVAARGIHVEDVDVVIHYDLANDHKDYVHRSGRTARAGATGTVISMVVAGQDKDVRKIQRAIDIDVPIEAPRGLGDSIGRPATGHPGKRTHPDPGPQHRSRLAKGEGSMSIFVGNLAWRTTPGDLKTLFAEHGTVQRASISTQRNSGRSKGFGFVEMPSVEAEAAIGILNGADLDGRPIRVRPAR